DSAEDEEVQHRRDQDPGNLAARAEEIGPARREAADDGRDDRQAAEDDEQDDRPQARADEAAFGRLRHAPATVEGALGLQHHADAGEDRADDPDRERDAGPRQFAALQ